MERCIFCHSQIDQATGRCEQCGREQSAARKNTDPLTGISFSATTPGAQVGTTDIPDKPLPAGSSTPPSDTIAGVQRSAQTSGITPTNEQNAPPSWQDGIPAERAQNKSPQQWPAKFLRTAAGKALIIVVLITLVGVLVLGTFVILRPNQNSTSTTSATPLSVYVGGMNGSVYALRASDGTLRWRYQTDTSVYFSTPTLVNGVVYFIASAVGQSNSEVDALRASDGKPLWRSQFMGAQNLDIVNGTAYVTDTGTNTLYALNASNGVARWQTKLGGTPGQFVIDRGVVYISSGPPVGAGEVQALKATDGTRLWEDTIGGDAPPLLLLTQGTLISAPLWSGVLQGFLYRERADDGLSTGVYQFQPGNDTTILAADGRIYLGAADGEYVLNASDGSVLWHSSPDIASVECAVLDKDVLYLGADASQSLYALSATDGSQIWSYTSDNGNFSCSLEVIDGVLYNTKILIGAGGADLDAFNVSDGSLRWQVQGRYPTVPVVVGGTAYLAAQDGYIYALNTQDGLQRWRYQAVSNALAVG